LIVQFFPFYYLVIINNYSDINKIVVLLKVLYYFLVLSFILYAVFKVLFVSLEKFPKL